MAYLHPVGVTKFVSRKYTCNIGNTDRNACAPKLKKKSKGELSKKGGGGGNWDWSAECAARLVGQQHTLCSIAMLLLVVKAGSYSRPLLWRHCELSQRMLPSLSSVCVITQKMKQCGEERRGEKAVSLINHARERAAASRCSQGQGLQGLQAGTLMVHSQLSTQHSAVSTRDAASRQEGSRAGGQEGRRAGGSRQESSSQEDRGQ